MEMSEIKNMVTPETLQFVTTPRKMLIDGNWVDSRSEQRLKVANPANAPLSQADEEPVRGFDKMVLVLFLMGLGLFGLISVGDLLFSLFR